MSKTAEFIDPMEAEFFLEAIRTGMGVMNAAFAVDWTPAQLKRYMQDPDFAELIDIAKERRIETIEETLYAVAARGNVRAIETILFCQAAERGWRPPTQRVQVDRNTKVQVSLVQSTVEAARQLLAQADPAALQPGGALDAIDVEEVGDGDAG